MENERERENGKSKREKLNLAVLAPVLCRANGEFAQDPKAKFPSGLIRHGPLTHALPTSGNQLLLPWLF